MNNFIKLYTQKRIDLLNYSQKYMQFLSIKLIFRTKYKNENFMKN